MQTNTIKSILAKNNLILQLCGTLSMQRLEVNSVANNRMLLI